MDIKISYDIHPAAELYPMMGQSELAEMAEDIRQNGLLTPVELLDDQVVDGRNRLAACEIAGVEPSYVDIELTDMDVVDYVISKNEKRRQLTTSQRAMVAVSIANLRHGGDRLADRPLGQKTIQNAADEVGVSRRTVVRGKRVADKAPKEVSKAVKSGVVTVNDAEAVSSLPEEEQKMALDSVKSGESKTMAQAVAKSSKPEKPKEKKPATLSELKRHAKSQMGVVIRLFDDMNRLSPSPPTKKSIDSIMQDLFDAIDTWPSSSASE